MLRIITIAFTAQKMKSCVKHFVSISDQTTHLQQKSLMKNFVVFFCSVLIIIIIVKTTDVQKSTCNKNQNSNVPFCFLHWYYIKVKVAKSLRHCLSKKICLHLRTPSACWAHWKKKFSIKDFSSKCEQIRRKLQIRSRSLKKSLMRNVFVQSLICTIIRHFRKVSLLVL